MNVLSDNDVDIARDEMAPSMHRALESSPEHAHKCS
jgi:hypothetical protein